MINALLLATFVAIGSANTDFMATVSDLSVLADNAGANELTLTTVSTRIDFAAAAEPMGPPQGDPSPLGPDDPFPVPDTSPEPEQPKAPPPADPPREPPTCTGFCGDLQVGPDMRAVNPGRPWDDLSLVAGQSATIRTIQE